MSADPLPAWDVEEPAIQQDRATELANAEEVNKLFGPRLRYDVDRGEYVVYEGTHWRIDLDGQVPRWAKEVARTSVDRLHETVPANELVRFRRLAESAVGISGVLKLLQTEPGVSISASRFDQGDYLVNCPNGTLDLRTESLKPHSAADLITHMLTTPYFPAAQCTLWESIVHRSMGGNLSLIQYLRRWCGLFLSGCPNVHELLIAHGVGANGKSVIFDTLIALLGTYATVAPESLLIARHGQCEHPTEIAGLVGKRLVVASETESGATLRLQLVKRLTGDLIIKARFMRQDFFEFRRTHKLVLITNNKPRLTENTEAVWRRLRLLPFNVVIPPDERDPNLLEKLRGEFPGILRWCVRGFRDWQKNGMNPPAEVLIATDEYRQEADEVGEFVAARCIEGEAETFRVGRTELHAAYLTWAKANNIRHPLERTELYEAIRRRDGVIDGQWKIAGSKVPVRGFKGIGLCSSEGEGSRQDPWFSEEVAG